MKVRNNEMNRADPTPDLSGLNVLLMLVLAASLSLPSGYTIGGALFAGIGLYYLSRRLVMRAPLLQPALAGRLPLVFMGFAVVCASIDLWHSVPSGQYEMYIPFLCAPLIFLAVLDGQIDRRFIWMGCLLGAALTGVLAVYQSVHLGLERPSGFLGSPIFFGNNAILLGSVALAGRHDPPFNLRKPVWFALTYVGFFLGIAASLISQSKGGWPFLPVVLLWVLVEDFRRASKREWLSFLAVAIALVCLLPLMPVKTSVERINNAAIGTVHWFQTGQIVEGSAAPRLELWKFGLITWSEKPWLGHSREGVSERLRAKIELNEVNPGISHIGALHNEALQLLAEKGLIGLLSWVSMLAASALVFWRAYAQPDQIQKMLGQAGLVVVTASLVFGLSDTNLIWNVNRQMFVILVMTLAALVLAETKRSG